MQCQVYLSIAMTRIRNRQHRAFSEVERQNELFEKREKKSIAEHSES